jgi:hypothetical protein
MFKNYNYQKPVIYKTYNTDALTSAFAGGGWLHLNKKVKNPLTNKEKYVSIREKSEGNYNNDIL